jgi:hypothetical protein
MASIRVLSFAAAALTAFGQNAMRVAPVPGDPLEMVGGAIQVASTPAIREGALQLLARARTNSVPRNAGSAYSLKVAFTVDSGGQTQYDGAWEMEDLFDPQQGLRWTATTSAGYTITEISAKKMFFSEGTSNIIPLRLQEARAALFNPIPSPANVNRGLVRISTTTFNGAQLTCVLLSGSGNVATASPGRRWEETEECIDPQSGLLKVHSQVPGRYYLYDYSKTFQIGTLQLPAKITVTEGGRTVSEIQVESLTAMPSIDANLFVPTQAMRGSGPAFAMAEAQKVFFEPNPVAAGAAIQPVCVFGLVTPSGQLVEAHSLQPSDPNSDAAVLAAQSMNFARPVMPGARSEQHFVFFIAKFSR